MLGPAGARVLRRRGRGTALRAGREPGPFDTVGAQPADQATRGPAWRAATEPQQTPGGTHRRRPSVPRGGQGDPHPASPGARHRSASPPWRRGPLGHRPRRRRLTDLLPAALAAFRTTCPQVGLVVTEEPCAQLGPALLSGEYDLIMSRRVVGEEFQSAHLLNEALEVALPAGAASRRSGGNAMEPP